MVGIPPITMVMTSGMLYYWVYHHCIGCTKFTIIYYWVYHIISPVSCIGFTKFCCVHDPSKPRRSSADVALGRRAGCVRGHGG